MHSTPAMVITKVQMSLEDLMTVMEYALCIIDEM